MPRVPNSTEDLAESELEFQRAILHSDVGSLDALLDEESETTGPDGLVLTKEQALEPYRSGRLRVLQFEVERSRVRVLDELGLTDVIATVAGLDAGVPFEVRLRQQRTWRLGEGWTVVSAHASLVRAGSPPGAAAGR